MAALGLRLYGIGFGLPALYRPDEDVVVGRAMGVLTGVFDPHFADWPHLYFYVAALFIAPLKAVGLVADQGSAYLAVRVLDAIIGAFTVLALYAFGRRAYSRPAALIGALGLTVAFLHVRDSHFATLDVPLTLACVIALFAAYRIANASGRASTAGWALGVATALKYNGALAIGAIATAQLVRDHLDGVRLFVSGRRVAMAAAIGMLVFLVASPFLVLDPATTIHGISYVFYHLERQTAPQVGWVRMPIALWYGLDPPLFVLATAGVILAALRRTAADLVLLAFAGVFYALIGSGHSVFFRYVDPLIPVLMLLAGRALMEAIAWLPRRPLIRPAVGIAALAAVLIPALAHDVRYDALIPEPDTRALAYQWMGTHMPAGGLAAVPYLAGGIHDRSLIDAGTHSHGAPTPYIASFLDGRLTTRYRVHELTPDEFQSSSPAQLAALGVRYAVIAYDRADMGCTISSPLERELRALGPPVATFAPTPSCPSSVFDVIDDYYVPVSGYDGYTRPGPFIRIYQVTPGS